ncbi:hypothetical protein G4B88_005553 [Cannabis sativa]|uniref:Uncharacterized protein n=1 Tax=Cannabis sativa TaxID=3483 RepID=A0A7J6DQ00_CANSA|nr:hypothetical protein G4B88_005553 [Cannabis sativa]
MVILTTLTPESCWFGTLTKLTSPTVCGLFSYWKELGKAQRRRVGSTNQLPNKLIYSIPERVGSSKG